MEKTKLKTINDYIGTFPAHIQERLEKIRQTIRAANPEAEEGISYNVPTFRFKGILMHFAAFKNHIGFFPTPSSVEAFKNQLSPYETSKGSINFPMQNPFRTI